MSTATLNGKIITALCLTLPAWGVWTAEADVADAGIETGAATLVLGDLTLKGTIVPTRAGSYASKGKYRIVGGAGGWAKKLPAKGYRNDAGVKISLLLKDAAQAAGEQLPATLPAGTVGTTFARAAGPGSILLNWVAEKAWFVDENGVTQLAPRATSVVTDPSLTVTDWDPKHGRATVAPVDKVAELVPGAQLTSDLFVGADGKATTITAGDVVHHLGEKRGSDGKSQIQLRTVIHVVVSTEVSAA